MAVRSQNLSSQPSRRRSASFSAAIDGGIEGCPAGRISAAAEPVVCVSRFGRGDELGCPSGPPAGSMREQARQRARSER